MTKQVFDFDILILGGGPAGMSAGVYAARGAVKTAIVDKYMNLKMGARPLKRAIQSEIEDMLAEEILAQRVKNGDTVKVRYQDKKIVFDVVSK